MNSHIADKARLRKVIGRNIKKHRKANKLSLDELSERIGISPGFLGLVENGQRGLALHNLLTLTRLLDVTIDELWMGNDVGVATHDSVWMKKIMLYCNALSLEQQERLLKIIRLIFPPDAPKRA